jgi:hypothetical protein
MTAGKVFKHIGLLCLRENLKHLSASRAKAATTVHPKFQWLEFLAAKLNYFKIPVDDA